ncbi:hypothetical protein B9Q11_00050 [Candidatus Marsarchaeota G2 archaeon ECH_B_SAG-F08]|uniref:Uncharacterized protein n=1 Tax=Candidatus Marsarchaeota G2 archaeon ECH_B_SAG-F08 TaxID=1978165 RepID=A0A2R6BPF8_9ARCH|nr:MAG: hypothetical protein B9Q11_00050 [Candidatus Marsarchaeota G2 archaeon ECH_B_SAG-F08]
MIYVSRTLLLKILFFIIILLLFSLSNSVSANKGLIPVRVNVTDSFGTKIPTSSTKIVIANSSQILYSGPIPLNDSFLLPAGSYSIYAQNLLYGFNASVFEIDTPSTLNLKLSPYTYGTLIDTKTHKIYPEPKDPAIVLRVVLGINQSDQLPSINSLPTFSIKPNVPLAPPCGYIWVLYKTVNLGWIPQLQGAVYSYYINSSYQIVNTPSVTQYSVVYSYVSTNGGPVSQSSAVANGTAVSTSLPTASHSSNLLNYDVYINAQWYDYIYKEYNTCIKHYTGNEKEVFEVHLMSSFYQKDSSATSTSDYSFSAFRNVVSQNLNSQTFYVTFSDMGTQATSFSVEATLAISASFTGREFTGSFNIAGYTSLNSQTQSTQVMYTLTAYGSCKGYMLYKAGWVLGFSKGPGCL